MEGDLRERYAARVDAYLPKAGVSPEEPYFDPARALGPPDGKTVALGVGASVTLRFFRRIPAGEGPDLRVFEVGSDGANAQLAVSEDGQLFLEFPRPAESGQSTEFELDELGLSEVRFVRVSGMDNAGNDPGFDLDAVEALH